MVRAPCCEKLGLKKGPWTPEEDQVLVDYIQKYGHGNWRALPKQAGLLRCGKSCRLRWMNYLKPDIKRGNFTPEEEETIINLHEKLGNRWSAIAAKLPGRTDNEIKNVWHTHLKKRVNPSPKSHESKKKSKSDLVKSKSQSKSKSKKSKNAASNAAATPPAPAPATASSDATAAPSPPPPAAAPAKAPAEALMVDRSRLSLSPSNSCSDLTSSSSSMSVDVGNECGAAKDESFTSEEFPEIDESFWMEVLSMDDDDYSTNSAAAMAMASAATLDHDDMGGMAPDAFSSLLNPSSSSSSDGGGDDLDFWSNVFMEAGGLQEVLPQF